MVAVNVAVPGVGGGDQEEQRNHQGSNSRGGRGGDAVSAVSPSATDGLSVEQLLEGTEVPPWQNQVTFRSIVVSLLLGFFLSFIVMKLNLTSGIIPSLNVSAGLLGFFLLRSWTTVLDKAGLLKQPFTRQENTVVQTCVVACYGIAFSGGFGSYILGMTSEVAIFYDDTDDNTTDTKNLTLGWLMSFLFVASLAGVLAVLPLRRTMILDYKLTYPSGTATAHLINSLHTPLGALIAKKQVSILVKSFLGSFSWSLFQWFYQGGDDCGFSKFPTFGLNAFEQRFYFDFSLTYIGVGMICPFMICFSMILGSIISWGILWPYIRTKKGDWYDATLPESSLSGLNGYKIFISISMIVADGIFHFVAVLCKSSNDLYRKNRRRVLVAPVPDPWNAATALPPSISFDDRRRTKVFLMDDIPNWVAVVGYLFLLLVSLFSAPYLIPELKFGHIVAIYAIAPVMAFCNSYGAGLTDWSFSSCYGKIAILVFGGWIGQENGGVLAGLAACGVMISIVSAAADLMQDFRTGYLTLTSPRSMFLSQAIGTAMGCVISPMVFWVFYKSFPLGVHGSEYPAPYAAVYRGLAILGTEGFSALPKHCVKFCVFFFFLTLAINEAKEWARLRRWWVADYVPSVMAMAIPFYLGSYFAIDMCLGSLIVHIWEKMDQKSAKIFAPAVASGLMCGDAVWSLPASLLSLLGIEPPICMRFLSREINAKVNAFLSSR